MTYALITIGVGFVLINVLAVLVCIGGYKFEENNDKNNPCHGCCSINECKQVCCGKRKCDKYIKCPF